MEAELGEPALPRCNMVRDNLDQCAEGLNLFLSFLQSNNNISWILQAG